MALIIEDGSIVPDADSYADANDLMQYAVAYGFALPDGTGAREALLRRAALQMQAMGWKGRRVEADQPLAWPRSHVVVDGEELPANTIPARIAYGQMALACEIYQDDSGVPEVRGAVVREKVDVVEVQYAEGRRLLPAAPDRQSRAQFADYLLHRGLFAIRA